jgi:hypothetical protein
MHSGRFGVPALDCKSSLWRFSAESASPACSRRWLRLSVSAHYELQARTKTSCLPRHLFLRFGTFGRKSGRWLELPSIFLASCSAWASNGRQDLGRLDARLMGQSTNWGVHTSLRFCRKCFFYFSRPASRSVVCPFSTKFIYEAHEPRSAGRCPDFELTKLAKSPIALILRPVPNASDGNWIETSRNLSAETW